MKKDKILKKSFQLNFQSGKVVVILVGFLKRLEVEVVRGLKWWQFEARTGNQHGLTEKIFQEGAEPLKMPTKVTDNFLLYLA